jgi:uncharacterized membrane protein YadS
MLGPVVVGFSLFSQRHAEPRPAGKKAPSPVPAFVVGFAVLAVLRSVHVIPDQAAATAKLVAGWLTILAMAALGLGVDLRSVRQVGARVMTAVAGALGAIICLAVLLIHLLPAR